MRIDTIRRLAGELEVLTHFDALRSLAGHDYGAGQRGAELSRRRHELDDLRRHEFGIVDADHELDLTAAELAQAFERVGRPRMLRLKTEGYRSTTKATTRTRQTWRKAERRFSRESDAVQIIGTESELADEPLRPGERVVNGVRLYSAAWLSRRPADEDRCGGRNTLTRFADVDRCTP